MKPNQNLMFDIDLDDLKAIQLLVGATNKEMLKAYNRALSRTAVTIRKLSTKMLKDSLQARNAALLRRRLKQFKVKQSGKGLDELKLWFGLNDLPASSLKGRSRRKGSKKKPNGAVFIPASPLLKPVHAEKGFVAKIKGPRSVFTRNGKERWDISEVMVNIEPVQEAIEDDIFVQLPQIFLKHFETDLRGRVAIR